MARPAVQVLWINIKESYHEQVAFFKTNLKEKIMKNLISFIYYKCILIGILYKL